MHQKTVDLFVRTASQIWVVPPLTSCMNVHVDEPTPNCLCSPPLPLPLIIDTTDVGVDATLDADESLDLLTSEFCEKPTTRLRRDSITAE